MGTQRACGFNFRGPMFVSVRLLTASAVLLLHFGHGFNLVMGYQVVFTLFAYGLAGWVWCRVNWGRPADDRRR